MNPAIGTGEPQMPSVTIMVKMNEILQALRSLELMDDKAEGAWPPPPEPDPERVNRADVTGGSSSRPGTELAPDVLAELESLATVDDEDRTPELLDRLAWYAPLHFAGERWGIYITEDSVIRLAGRICGHLSDRQVTNPEVARRALRSALRTLYFHEAFHHCTESFAIRLELTQKAERYRTYHREVCHQPSGEDQPLEEALACADMVRRQPRAMGKGSTASAVREATVRMLEAWIPNLPNGYRKGLDFVEDAKFNEGKDHLSAMVQQGDGWDADDVRRWGMVAVHYRGGIFRPLGDCAKNTYLVANGPSPRLPDLISPT